MQLNHISKSEVARYMGVKGEPDHNVQALLDEAEKTAREKIQARYVYKVAALSFGEYGVFAEKLSAPLTGKDIRRHLERCTHAVFLAATLTTEADKLIRQASVHGAAEALAADSILSAAIEQVCDRAEEEIFSLIQAPYRTWRYSPGYGDFPLDFQKELLEFLDAQKRIGLTVTENCLLIPSKSVTAVIGVSDKKIELTEKSCVLCTMRGRCAYSNENGSCARR